jgi:hypothetical protein
MIAHIQQLARSVAEMLKAHELESGVQSRTAVLVEELNQLHSRDFLTAERYGFVDRRRRARQLVRITDSDWKLLAALKRPGQATKDDLSLLHVVADALEVPKNDRDWFINLDSAWAGAQSLQKSAADFFDDLDGFLERGYGGEGSHVEKRTFGWVKDKALRTIVERDYKELMLKVYPSGAWKMSVVAAGSILEAILYDLLTRSPKRIRDVQAASSAPKKRGPTGPTGPKVPRDIKKNAGEDKWDLINLIEVATELKLLPEDRGKAIDQTLRDWRNFVHPHKEMKAEYSISDAEAETAIGNLKCVCNHLEKT